MLYATTRSKVEIYTAQRALKGNRAPDGGLFVPERVPVFTDPEILDLKNQPASAIIADVLNRFFGGKLSQWDVEYAAGKELFGLTQMNHRIAVGELWRNPNGSFEKLCEALTDRTSVEAGIYIPGRWMQVAIRIAMLFALFGELQRAGQVSLRKPLDVAVANGDFTAPFAVWYARRMGLPVQNIVCCCNENGSIWDLVFRGQMKLGGLAVRTNTPDCDHAVPDGLEWLIYTVLDRDEVAEFLQIQEKGGMYELNKEQHIRIRKGMHASVVSSGRLEGLIPNLYRTNGYVFDYYGALAYAGLTDYRAVTGERRLALVLTEHGPMENATAVASALGVTPEELREIIN